MRQAWRGPAVRLVADGDARTTAGNARAVAAAARHIGADEVVIVTSSWHARRARLLVQAALDPNVRLVGRDAGSDAPAAPDRPRARRSAGQPRRAIAGSPPLSLGYVSRIAPATTSSAPSAALTENASPRKTTARMKTRTTLSRSSAATPVAGPSRSARK